MMRWRGLCGLLILICLIAITGAKARQAAPQFTATALDGQTFTNESLRGQAVLIEFWTTWCPICRKDEPAVENVTREFSSQGLVVLAVDVNESAPTVKEYLQRRARSCNIVLSQDSNLAATFAPTGFPTYVLIDREGNVAGTQVGGGGEGALRALLSRAGLGSRSTSAAYNHDERKSAAATNSPSSPKIIEVPRGLNAAPAKPLPATLFLLKNGDKLESHHYTIVPGSLRVEVNGQQHTIPLDALNIKATLAANHERGIDLKIPTNKSQVVLGF